MTAITDSVAALSLAIVLTASVLVRQSLTAPAPAAVDLRVTQWQQPCGVAAPSKNPGAPHPQHRHPPKTVKRVKKQLRTAYSYYTNAGRKLTKDLYGVLETHGFTYNYDWLPQNNYRWYTEHVLCLQGKQRISKALPRFYKALQNYSITFEAMRLSGKTHIEDGNFIKKRTELLETLSRHHKSVLCETWTALINLGIEIPEDATVEILPEEQWEVNPDHSHLKVRDWGVISKYGRFLDDWTKIMRQVVSKKLPTKCNKVKSVPP
ncbi:uncharacterized protein [Anabrus simplex]|uniref:uncharacterized protein isoform X2 n=1 Tax=Anabrus simplex TaxID=316456 RepID=UPI0034DD7712